MTLTITVTHKGGNTFDTRSELSGIGNKPTPAELIALVQELEDARRIIKAQLGTALTGSLVSVHKSKQEGAVN